MAATYRHTIEWSGIDAASVVCTGDFDDWKGTVQLAKGEDGVWRQPIEVPYAAGQEHEIKYKFVVDGKWQHATDQPTTSDDAGNVNNVFKVPSKPESIPQINQSKPDPASTSTASAAQDPNSSEAAPAGEPSGSPNAAISASSDKEQPDIPATIAQLLGNARGEGGENGHPFPSSNLPNANGQNFFTYNLSQLSHLRHLDVLRTAFPSRYLLQAQKAYEAIDGRNTAAVRAAIAASSLQGDDGPRFHEVNDEIPEKKAEANAVPASSVTPDDLQVALSYRLIRLQGAGNNESTATAPGILKILDRIREAYPSWSISEKRLRRVVKDESHDGGMAEADRILRLAHITGPAQSDGFVPVSKMDDELVRMLQTDGLDTNPTSPLISSPVVKTPKNGQEGFASRPITDSPALGSDTDKENLSPVVPPPSKNKKKSKKNGQSLQEQAQAVAGSVVNTVSDAVSSAINAVTQSLPGQSVEADEKTTGQLSLHWFDEVKGKGVISNNGFKRSTVIFKEEAFVFAPTKTIQSAVNEGQACGYCGKLFLGKVSALIVPCTSHDSLPSSASSTSNSASTSSASGTRKVPQPKKKPSAMLKKQKPSEPSSSAVATKDKQSPESPVANGDAPTMEEKDKKKCHVRFCNKLCRDRNTENYASLTCPLVNPSYAALLAWSEGQESKNGKQNVLGVFKIYLRLLVTAVRDGFTTVKTDADGQTSSAQTLLRRIECLSGISERLRRSREMQMIADLQWASEWIIAHRLVMEALQLPAKYYKPATDSSTALDADAHDEDADTQAPSLPGKTVQRTSAVPAWLRNAEVPQELVDKIFGFDNFLIWLGRVALNQEDDGGIYFLHPCLNHACEANAIVKRTPSLNNHGAREAKPSRIYVVAIKDIAPGEEITISYVSPSAPVEIRRSVLRNTYLFDCDCAACQRQLAEHKEEESSKAVTSTEQSTAEITRDEHAAGRTQNDSSAPVTNALDDVE